MNLGGVGITIFACPAVVVGAVRLHQKIDMSVAQKLKVKRGKKMKTVRLKTTLPTQQQ